MSLMTYERKRPIPEKKVKQVQMLVELFKTYDKLVIFDFKDVPANMMKEIRKKLYGLGHVIVVKNTLVKKALDKIINEKPNLRILYDYLTEMRAFVFTNMDVFEISRIIDSIREKQPAKPGKIAPYDIIIPKGNTGLKPGPAMTDLRLANIPSRIIKGELWVMKATLLVKKGQRISSQAAKVLQLLDIIPFEIRPKVLLALDRDKVISAEILLMPIEKYERLVSEAVNDAIRISVNLSLPTPETIETILLNAMLDGFKLAIYTDTPLPETAEMILFKAINIARATVIEINKINPDALPDDLKKLTELAPAAPVEEKKEEKPAKEEKERREGEERGGRGSRVRPSRPLRLK